MMDLLSSHRLALLPSPRIKNGCLPVRKTDRVVLRRCAGALREPTPSRHHRSPSDSWRCLPARVLCPPAASCVAHKERVFVVRETMLDCWGSHTAGQQRWSLDKTNSIINVNSAHRQEQIVHLSAPATPVKTHYTVLIHYRCPRGGRD